MLSAHENNGGASFSIVVIRRILDALSNSGGIKKTNLAGKTGLNYPNCVRYIELLKILGWVKTSDDGTNYVYLTEHGVYFSSVLTRMGTSKSNGDSIIGSNLRDSIEVIRNTKQQNGISKSSYNIMLVDDEPDVLLTFKVYLAKQGYNVEAFRDAKSALQNIASIGPAYYDLIITDIRMKSLNGLQLFHGVRSIDPNVKIIFVSALDAVEELVSVLPGVTNKDIIKKPIEEQEFIRIIKEAIIVAKSSGSGGLMANPPSTQK